MKRLNDQIFYEEIDQCVILFSPEEAADCLKSGNCETKSLSVDTLQSIESIFRLKNKVLYV